MASGQELCEAFLTELCVSVETQVGLLNGILHCAAKKGDRTDAAVLSLVAAMESFRKDLRKQRGSDDQKQCCRRDGNEFYNPGAERPAPSKRSDQPVECLCQDCRDSSQSDTGCKRLSNPAYFVGGGSLAKTEFNLKQIHEHISEEPPSPVRRGVSFMGTVGSLIESSSSMTAAGALAPQMHPIWADEQPLWVDSPNASQGSWSEDVSPHGTVEWWATNQELRTCPCDRCVMSPTSQSRLIWDTLSMLMLLYDMLAFPLIAFRFHLTPAAGILHLVSASFWTVDIPLTFLVGYYSKGHVEMRVGRIARRYVRHWFFLDAMIVSVDWLMMVLDGLWQHSKGAATITNVVRILRVFRVLRLVRILKLAKLSSAMEDSFFSLTVVSVLHVVKLLFCVVLICHTVGSAWYAIGKATETLPEGSWTISLENDRVDVHHRYAKAFHWAFAQFTPSSTPYGPHNQYEEVFNLVVLLGGFVVFTSFVGSMTTFLTQLRQRVYEVARQDALFKQFVLDNAINWRLAHRISNFVKHHHRHRKRVVENDVYFLRELPESLTIELRRAVFGRVLRQHPFLKGLGTQFSGMMDAICFQAAVQVLLTQEDEAFHINSEAKCMYFVLVGKLVYSYSMPGSKHKNRRRTFTKDQWLCEGALWFKYRHGGNLIAQLDTDVVALESGKLQEFARANPQGLSDMQQYARMLAQQYANDLEMVSSHYRTYSRLQPAQGMGSLAVLLDGVGGIEEVAPDRDSELGHEWNQQHFSEQRQIVKDLAETIYPAEEEEKAMTRMRSNLFLTTFSEC